MGMKPVDLVARARDLGVQVVQYADNMPLHELDRRDIQRIAQAAEAQGIDIEVGTVGLDPANLARYLAIATQLGSPFVRVVIDTPENRPSAEEIVATLRRVLPSFAKEGVRILIENHDRFPAKSLASILEAVDMPELGICLDTVNSLGSLEFVGAVWAVLAPWVMNVHVKDFEIHRSDHKMGFMVEGTAAGEGRLDIRWLVRQAQALPHDPNLILELWPGYEGDAERTAAKERIWVEESIAFLKSVISEW